jgi:hypothetical protein
MVVEWEKILPLFSNLRTGSFVGSPPILQPRAMSFGVKCLLKMPRCRLVAYGGRNELRKAKTVSIFRRGLKTHLFKTLVLTPPH